MTLESLPKRIHVVGIGGAGMSAIAVILRQQGHDVSGSDMKVSVAFDRLRAHGVELSIGHDAGNVQGAELVAISSAIPASNPEVLWAKEHGIGVVTRSELIPKIISDKVVIGVAGTHGKTTTTSMLSLSLMKAERKPSFIVGGELNEIGTNALWDTGPDLVIEADESDGTFLHLGCSNVIVTNVEPDHLDFYGSYDALKDAFRAFVGRADGVKVVCADSPDARYLLDLPSVVSYGFAPGSNYVISNMTSSIEMTAFDISYVSFGTISVDLAVPGRHNVSNAAAVIAMTNEMGVPTKDVLEALSQFTGVARRYQYRGFYKNAMLVDDYAHLPGEIEVVLDTAASQGHNRVVAVFQPHRYSRTAALYLEFAKSFAKADVVVVTDVYSAGELPMPGVTGELISARIKEEYPSKEVHYLAHRNELALFVKTLLGPGDICLTLGAGDLTTLFGEMLEDTVY